MADNRIKIFAKLLGRWLWLSAALLVIGTVIFIVIGRQTISNVDQLRPVVQKIITDNTGMQIRLGELKGKWPRLVPIIDVDKIEIIAENQTPTVVMDGARADLDLFNSIKYLSPIWRELVVDQLTLTVVEDASGQWSLKGLQVGGNTDLDKIFEPLIYSRLIRFKLVSANLEFFSGRKMQVRGDNVILENDDNFHRAELSLQLSDLGKPAYVLIEGQGDPSDLEVFHADGYVRLEDFNISKPVVDIAKSLLPELFDNLREIKTIASGEV
jgi:uncharacterized protein YhdP